MRAFVQALDSNALNQSSMIESMDQSMVMQGIEKGKDKMKSFVKVEFKMEL